MIFPGSVEHYLKPKWGSFAWTVVLINCLIYCFANLSFSSAGIKASFKSFQAKDFDESVSQMYLQTLDHLERKSFENLSAETVTNLAIKDRRFWSRVDTFPFQGDQVLIERNKTLIRTLKTNFENSVQSQYGLSPSSTSPWAWITYQFTHYSFIHLMGNLVFLFLAIAYLETRVSLGWIGFTYIMGGLGGGVVYLAMNSQGDLSMIGASGSVCALMAFLLVFKKGESMVWTYFFAPIPKGYGEIYLPAFLIFPLYLMGDFTAVLLDSPGLSTSVAHSAHIGGTLVGLSVGVLYHLDVFLRGKAASHRVLSDNNRFNELL